MQLGQLQGTDRRRIVVAVKQIIGIFAIQSPIGPTDIRIRRQVRHQVLEPLPLAARDGAFDVCAGIVGAELAQPNRGSACGADVLPIFVPNSFEAGCCRATGKPRLRIEDRSVVVGGVDQLVGNT